MILLELNQYFSMNSKEFKMCVHVHVHVCCECVCAHTSMKTISLTTQNNLPANGVIYIKAKAFL
jgi:hypothetical protein